MRILGLILSLLIFAHAQIQAQGRNTLEDFDIEERSENQKKNKRFYDYEEHILDNGFFIDLLQQGAMYDDDYSSKNYIGGALGIRMGSKWYVGDMDNYRPGFSVVWGRTNIIVISEAAMRLRNQLLSQQLTWLFPTCWPN